MGAITPADALMLAEQIAKAHRITIVPKQERKDPAVPGVYVTAYHVSQGRLGYQGKRRDPLELLKFVKRLAGVPA
jgi:hypothetical protein